ncbi:MAG: hypothetical protein ACK4P4_05485 [Allorhizobium sp.]
MAELAIGSIISSIAAVGGTILQVGGAIQQGREQEARFHYEQQVQEQASDEAQAASQRDALARTREGQFILSQQRAAIGAGGGNLDDPGVIDLMDDTQEQIRYASDTEIYKGEQQARGYNDAAKIAGVNASSAMSAAKLNAAGALFSGVSSMYSRFGQQAKKTAPASTVALPYG